ncbi:ATP-binding cassette transporter, subfamily B, member 13, group MDR/PGP protein PpABCB13 [Reticulomyxa filosa]|uniref:ATP-binding cassette transporter, subfamily B, member 13, group MDR/PGP protein PpABCB13 n=1 Tax=Reticulomyxa filosa TaxID=46433 RepID=X6LNY9_RETFI|nr:ATP-binding cassette transporter, subfamily B, member 13, group MDR/PGP protein PpABCB13 [Reticulomyxa filosa]|eukprot:ETO02425.1 ATP-binding cassette transporter, subfamily B, member 13, group MDR/PGP protein PpABCB13 [Reticulomyxa filosa]
MFGVMYGIGLWYGMTQVQKNNLKVGDMFGCYFSFMISGVSLGEMGSVVSDLQNGKTAANHYFHVKQRTIVIKAADLDKPIDGSGDRHIKGDIEFRNVSFAYASALDKVVMNQLSFHIRAGQTFAIVGPSGSGKSTVISLLERFYDPLVGEILIDGQYIHNYDIEFLVFLYVYFCYVF